MRNGGDERVKLSLPKGAKWKLGPTHLNGRDAVAQCL